MSGTTLAHTTLCGMDRMCLLGGLGARGTQGGVSKRGRDTGTVVEGTQCLLQGLHNMADHGMAAPL